MTKKYKRKQNNNVFEGAPVVDARQPLVVTVTKEDIKTSHRKTNNECAFAYAVKREYGVKQVRVHLARTYVMAATKNRWIRYQTPNALRSEIIAFDRGGEFQAERFTLLVPPKDIYKKRQERLRKQRKKAGGPLRAVIRQKDKYVLQGVRVKHNNGTDSHGRPKTLYDKRFKKPVLRSGVQPAQIY